MKIILSMLTIVSFVSCSQINVKTPSSRFISPETNGKLFSGKVLVEQQGATEGRISLANDQTDNSMRLRNDVTPLAAGFELGLVDKLDFYIKSNSDAPSVWGVKLQLLGDSHKDATKGNQSLALTMGYGNAGRSDSDSNSVFEDDDDTKADIHHEAIDISLIYGYRPEEDTLIYTSIQATKHDVTFKLEDSKNANLDGKKFTLNTWAYGASLGAIRYWDKYFLNAELSAQRTDWTHNDPMTFAFLNFAIGYKWN